MADWQAIKSEYITTSTSYRKLANKYGVDYKSVAMHGKAEGWPELRNQHTTKIATEILSADADKRVSRAIRLNNAADMLLEKVTERIRSSDPMGVDTQEFKHISAVLRDIKDIQGIISDRDAEEQDARIAKLRRDTQGDDDSSREITVRLQGAELDDYGG